MTLNRAICQPRSPTPEEFVELFALYLRLSWDYDEIQKQEVDPRCNPVPISAFTKFSIRNGLVLWILYQGHIQHYQLQTLADGVAVMQPVQTLCFSESSAFALTEKGLAFANAFVDEALRSLEDEDVRLSPWEKRLIQGQLLPYYDREYRLFSWGEQILKHFRQPAANQELILLTAEELGWLVWFDDPLPRRSKRNPKRLLHDTIKDLNRCQQTPLIHFKGDGIGMRIGWEVR